MKSKITLKKIDYNILFLGIVITLISWCYVAFSYRGLPEQIPSHFNAKGVADNYSDKTSLWVVLTLFTAFQYFVFLLAKHPSLHNFKLKNPSANFRAIIVFIPYLAAILFIIIYAIIQSAKNTFQYSNAILPSILTLSVVALIVMFSIIYKNSKS